MIPLAPGDVNWFQACSDSTGTEGRYRSHLTASRHLIFCLVYFTFCGKIVVAFQKRMSKTVTAVISTKCAFMNGAAELLCKMAE